MEAALNELLTTVQDKFNEVVVNPITSWIDFTMLPWYIKGAGIAAIATVVAYFFPFKWVKASLGFILLLVAAYIAGGYEMHKEMAEKAAKKAAKKTKSK